MGVEPRPLPVHSPRVANARKRGAPPQSRFPLRYRGRVQGGELALGGVRLRRGARPLPLRRRGVRLLQGVRQRTTLAGDGLHRVGRSGSFEASAFKVSQGLADNYIDGRSPNQLLSCRWTPHPSRCTSSKGAKPSGAVVCRAGVLRGSGPLGLVVSLFRV